MGCDATVQQLYLEAIRYQKSACQPLWWCLNPYKAAAGDQRNIWMYGKQLRSIRPLSSLLSPQPLFSPFQTIRCPALESSKKHLSVVPIDALMASKEA